MQPHHVDTSKLPDLYPTNYHEPVFWEWLGRTVATFGFLEEALGKAIFSFTATQPYSESEIEAAYEKWLPTLKKALSDPLGPLITEYDRALRAHPDASADDFNQLIAALREASQYRNVLCHGSWRMPNSNGASVLLFMHPKNGFFETPIDVDFLKKTQRHVAVLVCDVVNTVTVMGYQFPGSNGPGHPVLEWD